ncbi:hypothetical protein K493DRAFT_302370 [Basidiobolus meristosporus CBS 931.73]|uniref:Uncharacterized protein n=1 Tax=Basidiobolus meristosporus CBS 931.73 TaxID=1314790 RepID=A0A1Y1Y7C8_9FUNG|nr:hypothetical protein K493DRAFT_302370 [Basidiobolus meristosporus CBS 931.73]|eukprot:ORX93913.1 hypothetical protein K493DRAFT_302370 [Basidiobolus meristosporus CBS 931.73]
MSSLSFTLWRYPQLVNSKVSAVHPLAGQRNFVAIVPGNGRLIYPAIADSVYLTIFILSTYSTFQYRKANHLTLFQGLLRGTNDLSFLFGMVATVLFTLISNFSLASITSQLHFVGWIVLSKLCDELLREEYRVRQIQTAALSPETSHDFELDDSRSMTRFSSSISRTKSIPGLNSLNSRSVGNHPLLEDAHHEKSVVLKIESKSER